jgi:hypothetical protein
MHRGRAAPGATTGPSTGPKRGWGIAYLRRGEARGRRGDRVAAQPQVAAGLAGALPSGGGGGGGSGPRAARAGAVAAGARVAVIDVQKNHVCAQRVFRPAGVVGGASERGGLRPAPHPVVARGTAAARAEGLAAIHDDLRQSLASGVPRGGEAGAAGACRACAVWSVAAGVDLFKELEPMGTEMIGVWGPGNEKGGQQISGAKTRRTAKSRPARPRAPGGAQRGRRISEGCWGRPDGPRQQARRPARGRDERRRPSRLQHSSWPGSPPGFDCPHTRAILGVSG